MRATLIAAIIMATEETRIESSMLAAAWKPCTGSFPPLPLLSYLNNRSCCILTESSIQNHGTACSQQGLIKMQKYTNSFRELSNNLQIKKKLLMGLSDIVDLLVDIRLLFQPGHSVKEVPRT